MKTLTQRLPGTRSRKPTPDELYEAFTGWATDRGLDLYPHQDEAVIEVFSGNNLILATPTGSGKSMVATAAHFAALARDEVSFYTAPIKALVNEKFFALCRDFGAENVGMLTGDASVNPDAPIICCTAEVLANVALREGADADVQQVVMDEFHFYSEPERGWAWQVPLLELPQAQTILMSATLGDVTFFREQMTAVTGRDTAVVADAERPVPLSFEWSLDPLHEKVHELLQIKRAPVYIVHFTQKEAVAQAQALLSVPMTTREEKEKLTERLAGFRFAPGFGKVLSRLVRHGIGVHHAGMLPRYRRLVEQLAQEGLLKVVCGTDTLGVGINVPIRTVLLTGLTKFDGTKMRPLRSREFHQIAGRAGRAGYDVAGYVVCQAPEHVIENERALAKAGDDPKKLKKVQRKKAPEGQLVWTEEQYRKLIEAPPEALQSRMRMTNAMILNVLARPGDPVPVLRRLTLGSHDEHRSRFRLARQAITLGRGLLESGVVVRVPGGDEEGRPVVLTEKLQWDFALNQPLSPFALHFLGRLDREHVAYAVDVVSVIEATLDDPFPVLLAQQFKERGEAVAQMKQDGVEYEERMELLEDVTWPRPLAEELGIGYDLYRRDHPWVGEHALAPKAVVRDMYERGMTFAEYVAYYQVARSEGLLLRYLSDAYKALRQTVPESYRTEELEDIIEWLGAVVRATDSSLLDEWEALADPSALAAAVVRAELGEDPAPPPRPVSANTRALTVMVRNAMWRRAALVGDDDLDGLVALEAEYTELSGEAPAMSRGDWDAGIGDLYDAHEWIDVSGEARGPAFFEAVRGRDVWRARQVLLDNDGDRDWAIDATVDLGACDAAGELVLRTDSLGPVAGPLGLPDA